MQTINIFTDNQNIRIQSAGGIKFIQENWMKEQTQNNNNTKSTKNNKWQSILFLSAFILFAGTTIAQEKDNTSAYILEASYTNDIISNLSGGLEQKTCNLGLANMSISFDTEKAKWWAGGEALINGTHTFGTAGTGDFTGDFQGVSNIEAGNWTYIYELWYKQSFKNISVILGIQDLNVDFGSSEYAGLFLNGSFGTHSTIADNLPAPIFPLPVLGAQVQIQLNEKISWKTIVFDGCADDFYTNPHNTIWRLKKEDGLMTFTEFTRLDTLKKLPGTYRFGAYYHNHIAITDETNPGNTTYTNNYGIYMVIDQTIHTTKKGKQISLFNQTSVSPATINNHWYYIGFGCDISGLIQKRPNDIAGIAMAHAGFKQGIHKHETVLEASYQFNFNEHFFLQPDLQYIINPAGTDIKLKNATVATLRFGLTL